MTRDIAIKFNQSYGETLVVPEADIREEIAVVPGLDGQKMSKSSWQHDRYFRRGKGDAERKSWAL